MLSISITACVWNVFASSVAHATCAGVVDHVIKLTRRSIMPGSQYGASRPENVVTK